MRSLNSLKNIGTSIGTTIILAALGFFTRKIFVDSLGEEYLGLNGLLLNIIGMLSLVEGGIGTSIVYNLYKPLAEHNEPKIIALVQLYRRIYRYIALGVFLLSLCIYPFLDVLIKNGENLSYVSIVYFIFVFNNLIGYLMADKWSLINSDQKQYKLAGYNLAYQIGLNLVKIAILYYFKNYILFLAVEFFFTLGYNLLVIRKVNKLYPYVNTKTKYPIDQATKQNIITNVKALFLYSIGGYLLHSTDNIIISAYVGIGIVGFYSNYTLIVGQLKSLTKPIFAGVKDSVGNLVASEGEDKQHTIFNVLYMINFCLVSFVVVLIYNTINPFISWWLGVEYLLPQYIVAIICINYFVDEIRSSIMTFKTVSGIFDADKYVVFLTAVINLIISLTLVHTLGLAGVLLGTSISMLLTASWNWPRLVYKYTFKRSPKIYYIKYIIFAIVTLGLCLFTTYINDLLFVCDGRYNFVTILMRGIICTLICFAIYLLMFAKTPSFKYLITLANSLYNNFKAAH